MKIKLIALFCLLTLFFSCKKTQETNITNTIEEKPSQEITEKDLSKLDYIEFELDIKTEKIIQDWQEYYQIQDVINDIKKGDLSFFNDNKETIKTLFKDFYKNTPYDINSNATKARITALETKFYKLESLSNLSTTSKEELYSTIKEFLESFSNLNFQMNKKIEKDTQSIEKP